MKAADLEFFRLYVQWRRAIGASLLSKKARACLEYFEDRKRWWPCYLLCVTWMVRGMLVRRGLLLRREGDDAYEYKLSPAGKLVLDLDRGGWA